MLAPTKLKVLAMKEWDPQSIRNAIDLEYIPEDGKTPPDAENLAKDKVYKAGPMMIETIIHIALYSDNEGMRLKAATYLADKALGKTTDEPISTSEAKSALEKFASVRMQNGNN